MIAGSVREERLSDVYEKFVGKLRIFRIDLLVSMIHAL